MSAAGPSERLPSSTFNLPVERLRDGYYSDAYFAQTCDLLAAEATARGVLMQVFQRHRALLGGVDEAIAVLREPWETVLTIEGDYALFAHLETVYLGSLARRSLIMRNVREVVDAAAGKPIVFFPARHDHWLVQTGDGWAAHVADALGDDLWGVRLDTSDKLVDRSLWAELGAFDPTGVNPRLVEKVRAALDAAGHPRVRIVVSGGFDAARIAEFERLGLPVDAYGVGSSLIRGANDFTADVVRVDGRDCAKAGRGLRPNPRLAPVD